MDKKKKKKPPLTEISFQQSTIGVIKIFHLHEICSKHCPPSTVTFASDFHLNFRHTISIHIAFHPSIHHLIMIFHLHELFSKHFQILIPFFYFIIIYMSIIIMFINVSLRTLFRILATIDGHLCLKLPPQIQAKYIHLQIIPSIDPPSL